MRHLLREFRSKWLTSEARTDTSKSAFWIWDDWNGWEEWRDSFRSIGAVQGLCVVAVCTAVKKNNEGEESSLVSGTCERASKARGKWNKICGGKESACSRLPTHPATPLDNVFFFTDVKFRWCARCDCLRVCEGVWGIPEDEIERALFPFAYLFLFRPSQWFSSLQSLFTVRFSKFFFCWFPIGL